MTKENESIPGGRWSGPAAMRPTPPGRLPDRYDRTIINTPAIMPILIKKGNNVQLDLQKKLKAFKKHINEENLRLANVLRLSRIIVILVGQLQVVFQLKKKPSNISLRSFIRYVPHMIQQECRDPLDSRILHKTRWFYRIYISSAFHWYIPTKDR